MIGWIMENDDKDPFERIGLAAWRALKVIREKRRGYFGANPGFGLTTLDTRETGPVDRPEFEKRRAIIGAAPGGGLAGHPSSVASGHDERPDLRKVPASLNAARVTREGLSPPFRACLRSPPADAAWRGDSGEKEATPGAAGQLRRGEDAPGKVVRIRARE